MSTGLNSTNAPLQIEWQKKVGIIEHLKKVGGKATKRQLFNLRPRGKRDLPNDWDVALIQLVENGIVALSGTGKRGDPVTVVLLQDLPAGSIETSPVEGSTARSPDIERLKALAHRLDDELAQETFERWGTNHEIETGKKPRSFYEERAKHKSTGE